MKFWEEKQWSDLSVAVIEGADPSDSSFEHFAGHRWKRQVKQQGWNLKKNPELDL